MFSHTTGRHARLSLQQPDLYYKLNKPLHVHHVHHEENYTMEKLTKDTAAPTKNSLGRWVGKGQ